MFFKDNLKKKNAKYFIGLQAQAGKPFYVTTIVTLKKF